ncbi:sulfatase-like hydrolase/transferase, partial [bacterium]|nr:sulfatase-like hydrolase/transferase [bacterium]
GKWHVGNQTGHWPCDRGFDRFYGSNTSPGNYYQVNNDNYDRRLILDDEEVRPPEEWYCTDAFTDYAIEFMRDNQKTENPFFLYLAYTAPHWPLHALPADVKTYRGRYKRGWEQVRKERYERMVDMGLVKPAWDLSPLGGREWDSLTDEQKDEMDLKMAVYAAMIDRMDQNIGRVVRALKEMGVYENTLILFLSDNGGCHEGGQLGFDRKKGKVGGPDSYSSYGLCWANASNTPYRRYKSWVHEGGISTPLIAHWPGMVAKNTWSGQVGHVIDLMATCCDIAGAVYPKTYNGNDILPLQGKSLLPVLQGKQRKGHDELFWEHQGNQAIRQGKWKLVRKHKSDWALYDLVKDRTELNDLASRYPERVASMREKYKNWMQRCGVKPWPVKK